MGKGYWGYCGLVKVVRGICKLFGLFLGCRILVLVVVDGERIDDGSVGVFVYWF